MPQSIGKGSRESRRQELRRSETNLSAHIESLMDSLGSLRSELGTTVRSSTTSCEVAVTAQRTQELSQTPVIDLSFPSPPSSPLRSPPRALRPRLLPLSLGKLSTTVHELPRELAKEIDYHTEAQRIVAALAARATGPVAVTETPPHSPAAPVHGLSVRSPVKRMASRSPRGEDELGHPTHPTSTPVLPPLTPLTPLPPSTHDTTASGTHTAPAANARPRKMSRHMSHTGRLSRKASTTAPPVPPLKL